MPGLGTGSSTGFQFLPQGPPSPPPTGPLSPPPGYTSSNILQNDTFANFNNWNTYMRSWNYTYWGNGGSGSLSLPYSGGTAQQTVSGGGNNRADYWDPAQLSFIPGGGFTITCVPYADAQSFPPGSSGSLGVSGGLTQFGDHGVHFKTGGTGHLYLQLLVKQPSSTGHWFGFFLFFSGDQEFDIQESGYYPTGGGFGTYNSQIQTNWRYGGGNNESAFDCPIDLSQSYNTFGFEWVAGTSLNTYFTQGSNPNANRTSVGSYSSSSITIPASTDEAGIIICNDIGPSSQSGYHTVWNNSTPETASILQFQAYQK